MPNIGVTELFFITAFWIIPVLLTAWLAGKKGYNAVVWVIIAVFVTWIALIIVLVLPTQSRSPSDDGPVSGPPAG